MMAVGGWANPASIRRYLVQTRQQAAAFQARKNRNFPFGLMRMGGALAKPTC